MGIFSTITGLVEIYRASKKAADAVSEYMKERARKAKVATIDKAIDLALHHEKTDEQTKGAACELEKSVNPNASCTKQR